ncbi:MAG: class I SAM-dependent methyltransferase [Ferruginibacter sp.]
MNKEYVQQYAKLEREHWWFLVRQKIILQFLQKHIASPGKQLRVLNVGAAGGASSEFLKAFGDVVSVETEPLFIEYLRQQNIVVTEASITKLPFNDNCFDLVCAFDVIEHVADDVQAMKEMERVCKKDGSICITVPAFMSLWSQHDVVNGHHRRYKKNGLRSLFEKTILLKPIEITYFNSLLFLPILMTRKMSNLFRKNKKQTESDFTYFKTSSLSNSILKKIFAVELTTMKLFHFPFGASLIAVLKKNNGHP